MKPLLLFLLSAIATFATAQSTDPLPIPVADATNPWAEPRLQEGLVLFGSGPANGDLLYGLGTGDGKTLQFIPINDNTAKMYPYPQWKLITVAVLNTVAKNVAETNKNKDAALADLQRRYSVLIDSYNALLATAQQLQSQLAAANSRQQRFNNALALYSLMPKYQPPVQVNVTIEDHII